MRAKSRKAGLLSGKDLYRQQIFWRRRAPACEFRIGISSPGLQSHIDNGLLETIVCIPSRPLKFSMSKLHSSLLWPFKFTLLPVFLILGDNSTFHFFDFSLFLTVQSQSPRSFQQSLRSIHYLSILTAVIRIQAVMASQLYVRRHVPTYRRLI